MREPFSTRVIAFVCGLGEIIVWAAGLGLLIAAILLFLAS